MNFNMGYFHYLSNDVAGLWVREGSQHPQSQLLGGFPAELGKPRKVAIAVSSGKTLGPLS